MNIRRQVMYLYYLLGYRIMQKVDDDNRKEVISENTFILTLDGDVDFKPSCVHLLVDLMKKNRKLGAACGRIHPRGTGKQGRGGECGVYVRACRSDGVVSEVRVRHWPLVPESHRTHDRLCHVRSWMFFVVPLVRTYG
jgi:hypothetical protein